MSVNSQKDTIYIDVDDEITAIVDKLNASKHSIVALVLPKRAVVLQSIVNMKLLKRSADEADKRLVLITSEQGLLPIAGAVGVYTAKNLQSKPEIPPPPADPIDNEELLETEETEPEINKEATVGELSGDEEAVFESDAIDEPKPEKTKEPKKPKKDKKNSVPNFDSFRKKAIIGGIIVVSLMILAYWGLFMAPRATIVIKTQESSSNSNIEFNTSTSAQALNIDKSIVPAKEIESNKTDEQKAPATGQKDLGTKATGTVTLSVSCSSGTPTIPAGTGVSTGGLTFITSQTVTVASFPVDGCKFQKDVDVTAQANGDQYNITSGRTFTVAGFATVSASNDDAFTGGVTKMAKVISQQDIDSAKQKLTDNSDQIKTELQQQLEASGYYAITDTFTTKSENITISPELDQEASEVSVKAERVYTMTGVKQDDLVKLIENGVKDELDKRNLQIRQNGIDKAIFRVGNRDNNGNFAISMQVQVTLGPKIDEQQIKKDVAGKKRGDVQEIIKKIDGVSDVDVKFSPFWVNIVPKNTNRVSVSYQEVNN